MDAIHNETDKILAELENRIQKEYEQASKEVEKKMNDYLRKFEKKDAEYLAKVKANEMTMKEYTQWRSNAMMTGQRWKDMRDNLAMTLKDSRTVSERMTRDTLCYAYAINFNYGTFEAERGAKLDTSFILYDKDAVSRLLKDNPQMLPPPGKKVSNAIREGKAVRWDRQQIQSVMTQGILQGESIPNIAKRLSVTVGVRSSKDAIRYARTMTTEAQNAGRFDAYKRAQSMGIKLKKKWMATADDRTRPSHRDIDGEEQNLEDVFTNGCMYPGDPNAPQDEVWQCRCTMIGEVGGLDKTADMSKVDNSLGDMTYDDWKERKL